MTKYISEYRINKKAAECFRSRDLEAVEAKLTELTAKKPGVYTMQYRNAQVNRVGAMEGSWSCWMNVNRIMEGR